MPTVSGKTRSATPTGIVSDRLIVEMQDQIYQYDPNKTPMLTFLSQSSGSKASNPTFNHLEDEPLPAWTTAEALDTTETTIDVATGTGSYFRVGDLVLAPTSSAGGKAEVMVCVAVNTTSQIEVIRDWVNNNSGVGGTTSLNDPVFIIGNVNAEGAETRTLLSTQEVAVTNYTQIIRTPWGITGTLDATATYGGPDRVTTAKKMATQHAFEQERTFLFGQKRTVLDTGLGGNGYQVRSTGGILYWLSTNSVNVNGTLTHSNMESLAEKVFRYGSSTKVLLCSRRVMSQLDNIAEARIETVPEASTYGVNMRRYVTGHGDFLIKIHDMLDHSYAGYAIAIDMANVSKRFTVNSEGKRDALLRMNIQNPSADAIKNEYLSEVGLHIHLEKSHGWLYGVS